MRNFVVFPLALTVAFIANTASAQDGYLSAAGGTTRVANVPEFDFASPVWQGRATLQANIHDEWQFQGDAVFTHQDLGGFGAQQRLDTADLAAHIFQREAKQGLLSILVQYDHYMPADSEFSYSNTQWYVAIESLRFGSNFSIYGQIGTTWAGDGSGYASTGVAARLRGRYFFNSGLFVEGKLGTELLGAGGQTVTSTMLSLAIESQLVEPSASVFARYSRVSNNGASTIQADRVAVGLKWNFGAGSLWTRETDGAALDPFEQLHLPTWISN